LGFSSKYIILTTKGLCVVCTCTCVSCVHLCSVYVCLYAHVFVFVCVCYVCICVCMCTCVFLYVCICVHMCVLGAFVCICGVCGHVCAIQSSPSAQHPPAPAPGIGQTVWSALEPLLPSLSLVYLPQEVGRRVGGIIRKDEEWEEQSGRPRSW
jgi:hypothetical protein